MKKIRIDGTEFAVSDATLQAVMAIIVGNRSDSAEHVRARRIDASGSVLAIMRAQIAQVAPSLKLDGQAAEYIQGCYEVLFKGASVPSADIDTSESSEAKTDAEKAHDEMVKAQGSMVDEYRKRHARA